MSNTFPQNKIVGLIAGAFDPPLHEGHWDHLVKASLFCDYLIVSVTRDRNVIEKRNARYGEGEGRVATNEQFRVLVFNTLLKGLSIPGRAVLAEDWDGTQAWTLRKYRPHRFLKGGDRVPSNMPRGELDVCRELGIEIVYGVGKQLNESSKIMGYIK